MATVSHLGTFFATEAGSKTVTATPSVGDAIVVICANTGRTTSQRPTVIDNNGDDVFVMSDIRPVSQMRWSRLSTWKTMLAVSQTTPAEQFLAAVVFPALSRRPTITRTRRGPMRPTHPTVAYERVSRCDAVKNASADSMWVFIRNKLISANQETVFSMVQTGDTGGGLAVFSVSGLSVVGQGAARGGGQQSNQSAATPAPVLTTRVGAATQAALTTNPLVGAVFNATDPAGLTEPAGWTEASDGGYATPTAGLQAVLRSSGETASTITWGSASASDFCSLAVELFADPTAPGNPGFAGRSQTHRGHYGLSPGLV